MIEGRLKFDSLAGSGWSKRSKHSIVADRVTFLGGASAQESDEADFNADFIFGCHQLHLRLTSLSATDSITPAKAESNVEVEHEKKSYAKKG